MFKHVCRLWRSLINYFRDLNLFPSVPPSTDEFDLRNERISTRLFLLLLISSIAILFGYTTLVKVTKIGVVNTPTLAQYSQLYLTYSQTLTCPCSTISVKYETFLKVQYTSHQVCSSVFVKDKWIEYLIQNVKNQDLLFDDFRLLSVYIFQGLKAFCENTDTTISDSLSRFYSNEYITLTVTAEQLFASESQSLMKQFISLTENQFLLSLQTIRETTQSNALVAALQTNYRILFIAGKEVTSTIIVDYSECSCSLSATCVEQSTIYDMDFVTILFSVPGVYKGCFVIEALLQSTLECFYNQTCINILQSFLSISPTSLNVSGLDSSLSSRFYVNSTIQELVNELMVEEWNLSSIYEKYYEKCQPTKCTYTYITRNDAIYIVTILFGLVGGLVKVLGLLIPRLVQVISRLAKRIRRKSRLPEVENGKTSTNQ